MQNSRFFESQVDGGDETGGGDFLINFRFDEEKIEFSFDVAVFVLAVLECGGVDASASLKL